jgi:hypothetical protein
MTHDLEHMAGVILAFAVREAIRYPLYATIAGLIGVIWVIRRLPSGGGGAPAGAPVRSGSAMGFMGLMATITAFVAALLFFFSYRGKAPAVAAPKPVITQKVVRPVIVQHITHVTAAPSHTGLYLLIALIAVLLVGMVIRLNTRSG